MSEVERAQPWLGTLVSMRVEGLPVAEAHRAISSAFQKVATIHRLMSFHEPSSDVSRLNAQGHRRPVAVHPWTLDVLRWALDFSSCSDGCFDISVGAELVDYRFLPAPSGATCRPEGCWGDIELQSDGRVVFHRPLWIDLGGIAKGYAVDRATECLRASGAASSVVNAGGDLRVSGEYRERIGVNMGADLESLGNALPVIELRDGSVASSSGHRQRRWRHGRLCGPHVDGVRRTPAPTDRFVSIVAGQCVVADALTKIVMAKGPESTGLLRQFRASAHLHDPQSGWQHLEAGLEVG